MEPRLVSRGNLAVELALPLDEIASMEPRLVSRGNYAEEGESVEVAMLQWSRGS